MSRAREALRRDAGTTMSELVVVMFILSIVVIATLTLTIGFERSNAQNVARQDQIDAGRSAIDRLTRTLRVAIKPSQLSASCTSCSADTFVSGSAFGVQFYANIDNPRSAPIGPSRVTYAITTTGGRTVLTERVQRPDSATPTSSGWTYCNAEAASASAVCRDRLRSQVLARDVRGTGTALFTYYDENGAVLPLTAGALSSADLKRVLAVELHLTVMSDVSVAPRPTTFVQRVLLTNSQVILRPNPGATP
ncbi:type IV pilus modification PilV family protein [Cellulomonas shaoxiangyii]|uniref:Type II secretion system protein n=1 Tax=Cellulomonas shaoxiangyii TaxID=2566013 RepID=A0A4P7SLG4_9CELL|nr:hypothetical protein [Cellulomonas shaoxiangyii]QCB93644.1 hypothetical protein E5225_08780 [Cellulomonas shaoxiangyii]TGY84631.1 hypothetical protein E5226_10510 [Cellulomonas shaoxiangyii]